jgi:molybdopterin-guanine dinucleotide biosynthesis protein B
MLIVSFVGDSGTGKTYIISKLTEKLSNRSYMVGCIKHCPHGFNLDHPGKDSYNFKEKGAYGVVVHSPGNIGVIKTVNEPVLLKDLIIDNLIDSDFIFAEGFKESKGIKKIELLRKKVSEEAKVKDAIAIICDFNIKTEKKLLNSNNIEEIIKFLIDLKEKEENIISVRVNNENLPLNPFTKSMLKSAISGLIEPLKRTDKSIKKIDIKMEV